jgi:hypothetical protein
VDDQLRQAGLTGLVNAIRHVSERAAVAIAARFVH